MKKYKALKNHICGNNDGEQVCTCFDKGYKKVIREMKGEEHKDCGKNPMVNEKYANKLKYS